MTSELTELTDIGHKNILENNCCVMYKNRVIVTNQQESFTCNLEAERDDRETKEKHFSRAKSF